MKAKNLTLDALEKQDYENRLAIENSNDTHVMKKLKIYVNDCVFFAKFPLAPYCDTYTDSLDKNMSTGQIIFRLIATTVIPVLPIQTLLYLTAALIGFVLSTLALPFKLTKAAWDDKKSADASPTPSK